MIADGAEEDGARAAIYREEVQRRREWGHRFRKIWHHGKISYFSSQSKLKYHVKNLCLVIYMKLLKSTAPFKKMLQLERRQVRRIGKSTKMTPWQLACFLFGAFRVVTKKPEDEIVTCSKKWSNKKNLIFQVSKPPFSPYFSGFQTLSFWIRCSFNKTTGKSHWISGSSWPSEAESVNHPKPVAIFKIFRCPKDGSVYAGEWVGAVRLFFKKPVQIGWDEF